MRRLKSISLSLVVSIVILCLQLHVKSIYSEQKNSYEPPVYEQFKQQLDLQELSEEKPLRDGRIISDEVLLVQLAPLLASRSVENVAKFLKNDAISLDQRLTLLDTIITDSAYGFLRDDAIQLVLDVANMYSPGSPEQKKLFSVFLKHNELLKNTSPLYIAIANDYTRTYVPLLEWAVQNMQDSPAVQKDLLELKMKALLRAVDLGDEAILDKIQKFTPRGVTKQEATDLVWYVADTGNHPELLVKLKALGADMDAPHGKETPLIKAVERGDQSVVKQLIAVGVDLDKIVDPEYGTALQRAFATRNTEIEELLRKAGARE